MTHVDFIVIKTDRGKSEGRRKHRGEYRRPILPNRQWQTMKGAGEHVYLFLLKSPVNMECPKQRMLFARALLYLRMAYAPFSVLDAAYGRVSEDFPQATTKGDSLRDEKFGLYEIVMMLRRNWRVQQHRSSLGGKKKAEVAAGKTMTRNKFMAGKYSEGATLKALAEEYGLTKEGVRRILLKEVVPIRGRGRPSGKVNSACTTPPDDSVFSTLPTYSTLKTGRVDFNPRPLGGRHRPRIPQGSTRSQEVS